MFAARRDPGAIVDLLPWVLLLVVAIIAVVAALYFLRTLRNWQFADPDDEQALLRRFRELHRQGKLSSEEFREVQLSLMEQMQRREEEVEPSRRSR